MQWMPRPAKPAGRSKRGGEIKSSPSISGNRIYFGSYDQNLYCLAADTGALIWKYATEGPVHCTPAIDKKHVYVSGCDETFRAIDAPSGKQIYSLQLGAYTGASAALAGDHAYVGTFGNEVLGIDLLARQSAMGLQTSHAQLSLLFLCRSDDGSRCAGRPG